MHRLRRPSVLATMLVALAVVVALVVIATTDTRVDALAPVLIFSVAVAAVLSLLAPGGERPR